MKTLKISSVLVFFILFIFTFTSCENDDNITNTEDAVKTTEDAALAEAMFDDAFNQAEVYENSTNKDASVDDCYPVITIEYPEGTPFPRVVTIDFGTGDCMTTDSVVRSGKIIVETTAFFLEEGSKRIVTFEEFTVNGYQIDGTHIITNMGENEAGNWVRRIEIDGKVTTPEGQVITRISTRDREWIEGIETPFFFWDDVFSITGNASGVNRDGVAYSSEITIPLIKARNCRWVQEGEITITTEDGTAVINYGDGTCDNVATVTVNGEEQEIKFRW